MTRGIDLLTGHRQNSELVRKLLIIGSLLSSVGLLAAVGLLAGAAPTFGLAAAAVIVILGASSVNLAALPVLAFAAIVVVQRVGDALSVSDLVLFVAAVPAIVILLKARIDAPMRHIVWFSVGYQATVLFTVVAHPYRANAIEWVHELLLVAGAAVVGYAVGVVGQARIALTLFMLSCAAIAALTLASGLQGYATGYFGPVFLEWPFGMNKNFIGCVLAFAAVVAYAQPDFLRWRRFWFWAYFFLVTLGVLAAQSKQGLVSIVVGVAVLMFRRIPRPDGTPGRRRSKAVLLPLIPVAVFVYSVTRDQLESTNQFNAVHQRLTWYGDSLQIVNSSPWIGVGLRYWYTGNYPAFQPPNAELEVLASAGLIGLAGFLIMFAGILWVLWRQPAWIGTCAFALVLMRFVQGQLDLFWVAAQVSIPFLLAGMFLGHARYSMTRSTAGSEPAVLASGSKFRTHPSAG